MISKETLTLKNALVQYVTYLNGLSNYLPVIERKLVMKKHIEVLVNEAIEKGGLI